MYNIIQHRSTSFNIVNIVLVWLHNINQTSSKHPTSQTGLFNIFQASFNINQLINIVQILIKNNFQAQIFYFII